MGAESEWQRLSSRRMENCTDNRGDSSLRGDTKKFGTMSCHTCGLAAGEQERGEIKSPVTLVGH